MLRRLMVASGRFVHREGGPLLLAKYKGLIFPMQSLLVSKTKLAQVTC